MMWRIRIGPLNHSEVTVIWVEHSSDGAIQNTSCAAPRAAGTTSPATEL